MSTKPPAVKPAAPIDASMAFEQAQAELETLITRIEGGQVGLEESMVAYERGVALLKHCREILEKAEQTFTDLSEKVKG